MKILPVCKSTPPATILALSFLLAVAAPGTAEEAEPITDCSFCDTWVPYNCGGTIFASHDVLVVTRDSLALPGCSPAKARVVQQGFDRDYLDDPKKPLPIYVLYGLSEDPKCKPPIPLVHTGSLVEVVVWQPTFGPGSERMEAAIVQTTQHVYGQVTPAKIRWYLIRRDYNPGDEGSGNGAWIAVTIGHHKADEKLNEEWQRLLKVADGKKRSEWIRRQRLWLKAIDKRCHENGGAAPQWEAAYATMCLTDAFNNRIEVFQDLRNCIVEKKTSCPALATDDPSVSRENY